MHLHMHIVQIYTGCLGEAAYFIASKIGMPYAFKYQRI